MKYALLILIGSILFCDTIHGDSFEGFTSKKIEDGELNTALLDISSTPSSIVGGCVNVITGNYGESECDLIIPGVNPIFIQRHFSGIRAEKGSLWHGWDLNLPSEIKFINTEDSVVGFVNDRGANIIFEGVPNKHNLKMKPIKKQLRWGVTNCSGGLINSRSNIINKRLYLHQRNENMSVELEQDSGELLVFKCLPGNEKSSFSILKNYLPNGCSYDYTYNNKREISSVISKSMSGKEINNIKWEYYDSSKAPQITLKSSNGQSIQYFFHKRGENKLFCLERVIRGDALDVSYSYKNVGKDRALLVKKTLPNNRYLQIDYYHSGHQMVGSRDIYMDIDDARYCRVSTLYEPLGTNASPIRAWTFTYHLDKKHSSHRPIGGSTHVVDALGHKKIYNFSDEQRLTSIDHLKDNGRIYRSEIMEWSESGDEKTFLKARGITDSRGDLIVIKRFSYDKYGNVLKETLSGNLTGINEKAKRKSRAAVDQYVKTFTYKDNGLIASEDDGRKRTEYHYFKNTNLIRLKLVSDSKGIRERCYYSYDDDGCVIKEISDDGDSTEIQNLSKVTERHVKKITPTTKHPIGLPGIVEEWCLNLSSGEEEFLSRTENTYSTDGNLINQRIFDSSNQFCFAKTCRYDSSGNLVNEKNALGEETYYRYDANNNRILQQAANSKYHTVYAYDYSNRLIREEVKHSSGLVLKKTYSYDYLGNRITSTDVCNNTTNYRYDEFSRLIEKIYPPSLNNAGEVVQLSDKISYDVMNNPCEKVDSNGFITRIKYTDYGKPCLVEYSDGAFERFIYLNDGTLDKYIDANGVKTVYKHDYKGRKIKEEKFSPKGNSISVHRWLYNAFHLIAEINPKGEKTSYLYDSAGRQVSLKKGDSEIRYVYDSLGRQAETWELYEPNKYRKTIYEFDYLDRVISESVLDEFDALFTKKSFTYDVDGNRTHVTQHSEQVDLTTEIRYNFERKPVLIIHPDGSETKFLYSYSEVNELGQFVSSEIEIDANGIQTIKVMDTSGRQGNRMKKSIDE